MATWLEWFHSLSAWKSELINWGSSSHLNNVRSVGRSSQEPKVLPLRIKKELCSVAGYVTELSWDVIGPWKKKEEVL